MDTIKNYLENMFVTLPKTTEILKIKEDLSANMEDKYNEFKSLGKTENEAIGIVISEFGNIDELISEFDIDIKYEDNLIPTISDEVVEKYMHDRKKNGLLIAIGVFLCIISPVPLMLVAQFIGENSFYVVFSLIPLFIFVAVAVGLFIFAGANLNKYKYLEEEFKLSIYKEADIKERKEAYSNKFTLALIIGVMLCILSGIIFICIATLSNLGVAAVGVVLLMVAFAVFIFIYYGIIHESYQVLLQIEDYSKYQKTDNKVIGAVASVVWPLAICIFLVGGFIFNEWRMCWIIFPITGVLFGGFSGAYTTIKGK